MSLKALANKVLDRNSRGISEEYSEEKEGIFQGNNEGRIFHDKNDTGIRPLPFLDTDGGLIIPFNSDARYHWWREGQRVEKTEDEVRGWLH